MRVEASDSDLIIMFRLVKAGYGTLNEVEEFDARKVLQALFYEDFLANYQSAYYEAKKI